MTERGRMIQSLEVFWARICPTVAGVVDRSARTWQAEFRDPQATLASPSRAALQAYQADSRYGVPHGRYQFWLGILHLTSSSSHPRINKHNGLM
jgi:hypothetical protein